MKKKFLSICIGAFLTAGLTAGCSSSATEQGKQAAEKTEGLGYEKLVVGLDDTFAPMGFRDENGELTGADVELARAVGEELGVEIEFQPIDWSTKEMELDNGNIDMIWNGYSINDSRKERVLFTKPYLNNKQVVVTMADSDINGVADLAGKTVAAQAQSSAEDAINAQADIKDTFKELVTLETNDQCLRDLESGRSDAVVADEILIRYYISQKGQENYKILDEDFGSEQYGVGVRKDDAALADAVNGAFDSLKESGKTAEISEKWFGSDIILGE